MSPLQKKISLLLMGLFLLFLVLCPLASIFIEAVIIMAALIFHMPSQLWKQKAISS